MLMPFSPLQIITVVCALIGFLVSFVAIATPAWQVVYARELQQWIQNGLWLNCQTRPSGMYTCTYTFSDSDFQFYTSAELVNLRTPPFFAWQRHLLTVYLTGQLCVFLSFLSLSLSFAPNTRRLGAIAQIVLLGLGVILHVGASLTFAVFSQMVEYRFFHVSVSGIYEKHPGYSFYVECVAAIILVFAVVCAAGHLVRSGSNNSAKKSTAFDGRNYRRDFLSEDDYESGSEPYAFHQNRNTLHLDNRNLIMGSGGGGSGGSERSFCGGSGSVLTQPPLPGQPSYWTGGSLMSSTNTIGGRPLMDETAFAMRDLPTVPPPLPAKNYNQFSSSIY